jgi:serine protease Do
MHETSVFDKAAAAAVMVAALVIIVTVLGGDPFSRAHAIPPGGVAAASSSSAVPPAAAGTGASAAAQPLPDFASIAARGGPAVVNISVSGTVKTAAMPQMDPNNPFFDFFRRFAPPPGDMIKRGQGSGFIVSSEGVVLTNAHVVADASEVNVKLTDRREFRAKVVGIDKPTDIAVLKIDAHDLPTVRIGDPQRTRVGEWVLAIGSPFGFENSVTAGIVSAKSRSLPDEGYVPFIQTDVAINPGNSGGPLFNLAGEVIGINSQIYSQSGGYQGLSFAIPIDVAMKVHSQIRDHGKVRRGRLGLTIQELDQGLAESFGLAKPMGALVNAVDPEGPGAKAGVRPGDVVLQLNGKDVPNSSALPPMASELSPGSTAKLQVWRDGKPIEISMTVGELGTSVASAENGGAAGAQERLGVAVRPLTKEEKRQSDIKDGLVVEDVTGPAARAGIRPGDVIVSVNGEPVPGVDKLRAAVGKAGRRVALLIQRGDNRLFVPVELG